MNKLRRSKTTSLEPVTGHGADNGPKPLSEGTRIKEVKTIPEQMKKYIGFNPDKPEWTRIASEPKKGDSFYGKK
jgi:hypothetical protein